MLRVAIVEDEKEQSDALVKSLKTFGEETGNEFHPTLFNNAITFLEDYKAVYDIVFLDIKMPYMDGFEASKKLRELDKNVPLIFVTSLSQYAVKGYDVGAVGYILKPIDYYSLKLSLVRCLEKINVSKDEEFIFTVKGRVIKIKYKDIVYFEIIAHSLIIHTVGGETYTLYKALSEIEKELSNRKEFVRSNSCYIINLQHVTKIKGYTTYINGEELSVSHPRKRTLLQAFDEFVGKK